MTTAHTDGARADQAARSRSRVSARHPLSWTLLALLACSVGFAGGYRLLLHVELGRSAALFLGLPLLVGLLIGVATAPRSLVGAMLKGAALGLCLVAPLLGEAALWVAAAAPLVLGSVALLGLLLQALAARRAS
jgi:hypothetical protein